MAKLTTTTLREIFKALAVIRSPEKQDESIEIIKKLSGLNEGPLDAIKRQYNKHIAKKEIPLDTIYDAWQEAGSPDDMDEVVELLQNVGFTNAELKQAFSQAGITSAEGEDEAIIRLAQGIKEVGLANDVLKYMSSINESLIVEAPVSNKVIKDTFKKIADNIPEDEENQDEEQDKQSVLVADVDMSDVVSLTEFFSGALALLEREQFGRNRRI